MKRFFQRQLPNLCSFKNLILAFFQKFCVFAKVNIKCYFGLKINNAEIIKYAKYFKIRISPFKEIYNTKYGQTLNHGSVGVESN